MSRANLALRNAWAIAGHYGHHWAADASPAALAVGRYVLEDGGVLARADCTQSCWSTGQLGELVRAWGDDRGERYRAGTPERAPATDEEAAALSARPTCLGGGVVAPTPDEHGVYRDCTGTGRVRWECYPDGAVRIVVERPVPGRPDGSRAGYPVLSAWVPPRHLGQLRVVYDDLYHRRHGVVRLAEARDGAVVIVHVEPDGYRFDHWEALVGVLRGALRCAPDSTPRELLGSFSEVAS